MSYSSEEITKRQTTSKRRVERVVQNYPIRAGTLILDYEI
jgi:hypothetical protein